MKHELSLAEEFGPQLADGAVAARFRQQRIEPYLEICEQVVLDFTRVRSANSSFINALVAGVVEEKLEDGLDGLHAAAASSGRTGLNSSSPNSRA